MIEAGIENHIELRRKMIDWSLTWESYALEHGKELTDEQLHDAAQVGIKYPEKVRMVTLPNLPSPFDDVVTNGQYNPTAFSLFPQKWSCSLGYGILNKNVEWDNREYVLVSLAHTALCEQLGGSKLYFRQYTNELLTYGFHDSPLEQRAQAAASRARNLRALIKPASNIEVGGAEFDKVVLLLSNWIANWETFALKHGIELSDAQRADAARVGVQHPG